MAEEEGVHGPVPVAGEFVPGGAVPPVGVEAPVGEEGEFGEDVELNLWGYMMSKNKMFRRYKLER